MIIRMKDGSERKYDAPVTVWKAAQDIGEGLARAACAGEVNGQVVDLRYEITQDCDLRILTFEDEEGRAAFRHTASHILAQAVKRLYPNTRLAIGPAIKDGFYYDFEFETPISNEDLEQIEKEMKKIVEEKEDIQRFTLTREEAMELMRKREEPYKQALIEDLPEGEEISFYEQGEFVDLCAGPHLMNTKSVKAFRLTSIAGAYWRGSEKNKMLTRIYGTAFAKKEELKEYLELLEEAKKRDHRKLGKELGLFALMDEGPGFPFFLPKGMILKNLLIDYWRELHKREGWCTSPSLIPTGIFRFGSGSWDWYTVMRSPALCTD